jgi:hypothetical protein
VGEIMNKQIVHTGKPKPKPITLLAVAYVRTDFDPEKIKQLMIKHGLSLPETIESKEVKI